MTGNLATGSTHLTLEATSTKKASSLTVFEEDAGTELQFTKIKLDLLFIPVKHVVQVFHAPGAVVS